MPKQNDHLKQIIFFPKDEYPIFALSFYNFIPSCRTCNHIKSNNNYLELINPYDSRLTNDTFYFDAEPKDYGNFTLSLKAKYKTFEAAADILNEKLQLKELYKYHSYIPNELFFKVQLLNTTVFNLIKKLLHKTWMG